VGLFYEVALTLTRLCGLLMGILTQNIFVAILCYCMGSFIVIFIQLLWYLSLIRNYEKSLQND